MALTTLDQLNAALPGQSRGFLKTGATILTSGTQASLFCLGSDPSAGAIPSSGLAGDVPTKATTGAIPFANPASGNTYLGLAYVSTQNQVGGGGALAIYDRLWHNSGIVVTTATVQTVNSVALTRPDALGTDVEVWLHVYASIGAVAATPTISYTNQAGVAGQVGTCIGFVASAGIHRSFPFQLAAGDTGVRSIQSITLGVSILTGTIGLILRRLVTRVPVSSNAPGTAPSDFLTTGLPRIYDNACLELVATYVGSTGPSWSGNLSIING